METAKIQYNTIDTGNPATRIESPNIEETVKHLVEKVNEIIDFIEK